MIEQLMGRLLPWPEEPPPHPADAARYRRFSRDQVFRVHRRKLREAKAVRNGAERHRAVKRCRDNLRRLMKKEARL